LKKLLEAKQKVPRKIRSRWEYERFAKKGKGVLYESVTRREGEKKPLLSATAPLKKGAELLGGALA